MSWMQPFNGEKSDMEKAFRTPLGAASPLWWAFASAASAGVAYWWLTRWTKPMELATGQMLAMLPGEPRSFQSEEEPAVEIAAEPEAPVAPALEEAAAAYDLAPEAIEDVIDTPPASDPVQELTAEASALADDLTQLMGVGPKLAAALAERGVHRFEQIAGWTEDEIESIDEELNLKGRIRRDDWIGQAKSMGGSPALPALPD